MSLLNFVCHDMSASWSLSLALRTLGSLACDVGLLSKSRLLLTTVGLKLVKIYFFSIFYLWEKQNQWMIHDDNYSVVLISNSRLGSKTALVKTLVSLINNAWNTICWLINHLLHCLSEPWTNDTARLSKIHVMNFSTIRQSY